MKSIIILALPVFSLISCASSDVHPSQSIAMQRVEDQRYDNPTPLTNDGSSDLKDVMLQHETVSTSVARF